MEITRITEQNRGAFAALIPEEFMNREDKICLGAVTKERIAAAGMTVSLFERSVYIDWLYTSPEYREQGAASELLDTLEAVIMGAEVDTVEITFDEDADDLEDFLEMRGFVLERDESTFRVPVSDLLYSEGADRILEAGGEPVHTLLPLTEAAAVEKASALLSGIGVDPARILSDYTPELSFVVTDFAQKPTGCIILRDTGEEIEVPYLYNNGSVKSLQDLITGLYPILDTEEYAGRELLFTDYMGNSVRLVEELTGNDIKDYRVNGMLRGVSILRR